MNLRMFIAVINCRVLPLSTTVLFKIIFHLYLSYKILEYEFYLWYIALEINCLHNLVFSLNQYFKYRQNNIY